MWSIHQPGTCTDPSKATPTAAAAQTNTGNNRKNTPPPPPAAVPDSRTKMTSENFSKHLKGMVNKFDSTDVDSFVSKATSLVFKETK